ncbi:MAG: diphosphate--fructose-6-phosphate 1-phosphotransferase [Nitrospirota bacterium]|nr:diphosphate--fructose-6-phosphate 1-phosphotransferase [Nitrospirota bacterium]MDH4359591.1 diphosphate--fructose-6-phosphate 1-phosphotransferase [Nitrospirota bacterium]MDH5576610.1 diphosphate--fructose-6-phosphate 1-phosphotransferase [Nitrospirota bacterium]
MNSPSPKFAILVGGGPAPGINSVIEAATIRSRLCGADVVGIEDGFKWLMKGDLSHTQPLTRQTVTHLHFRGGSLLGTSRANPTKQPQDLSATFDSLQKMNVTGLITIGGDDTAFSALKLAELASGRLQVVHVPKTIDNDLCLPHGMPTFGFQTARHMGVELVKNLMIDAQTTSRWYFVVTMGRKAGHLALGIGKAAGATLTLIPEEFKGATLKLAQLTNILVGSVTKRLAQGRSDGVAVLAEGLSEFLDQDDLALLGGVERDEHGNIRLAELDIGKVLKETVTQKLKHYDVKITIVSKNIGYELRCADPIPFDMEYTRDLGYCAAQFLLDGGNGAMVSIVSGHFTPLPFKDMLDPTTGRTRVRMVDIESESYKIARDYMARLEPTDFTNQEALAQYAKALNISPDQFLSGFRGSPSM